MECGFWWRIKTFLVKKMIVLEAIIQHFFFFLKKHSFILKGFQNVMTFIGPLTFSGKYLQMPGFVLAQLLVCSIESFVKHLLSATYLGSKDETQTRHTRQLIFCFVLSCFVLFLSITSKNYGVLFRGFQIKNEWGW